MKKIKTYEMTRSSTLLYIIVHLLAIIVSAILPLVILIMLNVTGHNDIYIVSFITIYFIIIITLRPLNKSKVLAQFGEDYLKVVYLTFLFKRRKEVNLYWNEINHYLIQEDAHFIRFNIFSKSGEQIKFNFDADDNLENLKNFIQHFETNVETYNSLNFKGAIQKVKNIYQSRFGRFLAILIGCMMILIPIIIVNKNIMPKSGYLITFYLGSIYYLFQIYQNRNKS